MCIHRNVLARCTWGWLVRCRRYCNNLQPSFITCKRRCSWLPLWDELFYHMVWHCPLCTAEVSCHWRAVSFARSTLLQIGTRSIRMDLFVHAKANPRLLMAMLDCLLSVLSLAGTKSQRCSESRLRGRHVASGGRMEAHIHVRAGCVIARADSGRRRRPGVSEHQRRRVRGDVERGVFAVETRSNV